MRLPIDNTIERLENTLKANPSCESTQRKLNTARTIKANLIARMTKVSAQAVS